MKRNRSLDKLGVIMVISLLVLVGCAGISPGAPKTTIAIWSWEQHATEDMLAPILEFEKLNPDVDIVPLDFGANDVYDKLAIALAAGVGGPDIFQTALQRISLYAGMKVAQDITEVVADSQDLFPKPYWESCVYKGRVYGVPWNGGPALVFYRKDIFDEKGIDFPKNWQEYAEVAKIITRDLDNDGEPDHLMGCTGAWLSQQWIQGRGGQITNEEGEVLFNNNPIVGEVVQWLSDRVREDKTMRFKYPWDPESYELFKRDIYVTVPVAYWYVGYGLRKYGYRPGLEGKWRISRWLPWEEGDPPTGSNAAGTALAVSSQTKYPNICAEIVEYICGKDGQLYAALEHDVFPANLEALEELRGHSVDFFGGQRAFEIALDQLRDTPQLVYGTNWLTIYGGFQRAMERVVLEGIGVEKALSDAAVEVEQELE